MKTLGSWWISRHFEAVYILDSTLLILGLPTSYLLHITQLTTEVLLIAEVAWDCKNQPITKYTKLWLSLEIHFQTSPDASLWHCWPWYLVIPFRQLDTELCALKGISCEVGWLGVGRYCTSCELPYTSVHLFKYSYICVSHTHYYYHYYYY